MATTVAPRSLQRTNSDDELTVFLLIENKTNDHLLIISRDNLPPTLRNGKLTLNQKVTFRNEERKTIEGMIVYMRMYALFIYLISLLKYFLGSLIFMNRLQSKSLCKS